MNLTGPLASLRASLDRLMAHPLVAGFRRRPAYEAVSHVLARRGTSYLLYVLVTDLALIIAVAAMLDRPSGKISALLAVVWGVRFLIFLQRAVFDLMRMSSRVWFEARRSTLQAHLSAGQFPANRHALSPRTYLRAIKRAPSAPAQMRASADALEQGFTMGLTQDGFVQEWIAARVFRAALDHHTRYQST